MTRTAKKILKNAWDKGSCLVLSFVTIVAILFVTYLLCSFGCKITWTQVRMGHYHSRISSLEASRDYNRKIANEAEFAEQREAYRNLADIADKDIQHYAETRKSLHNSSDPVVAFAAENDFEFLKLVFGLAVLLLVICWVIFIYKMYRYSKLLDIIVNVEMATVNFILRTVFLVIGSLFSFVAHVCFSISRFFYSEKKHTHRSKKVTNHKKRLA